MKLQAQRVSLFNGYLHKWLTWKKKARTVIRTAGLLRILDNEDYASLHKLESETIFHLLQLATTTEGNALFLVDQVEEDRNVRLEYKALEKIFEGTKL